METKSKAHEFCRVSDRSFDLPYIPHLHGSDDDLNPGRIVQEQILKLVSLVGERAPALHDSDVPLIVTKPPVSHEDSTFHWAVWRVPTGFRDIANVMYHAILAIAEMSYLEGYGEGEQFIARITRGEISAADLSEHDARLANAKQKTRSKKKFKEAL